MSINEIDSQHSGRTIKTTKSIHAPTSIPLKEKVFQNDLEQFRKFGTIPSLFITHIVLLVISTYIIFVHSETLDDLVYHNRAIQSTFFFHQDTAAPSKEYKKKGYISTLPQFLSHLDYLIYRIYNINETLTFNVAFDTSSPFKINVERMDYNEKKMESFNFTGIIKNENHNPVRDIGNMTTIRRWLGTIENIVIELNYNCTIGLHYYQVVTLELKYNFFDRGIITYDVNLLYSLQGFMLDFNLKDINILLIIAQIALAICEIVIIMRKVYYNLKVLMLIKNKLSSKEQSINRFSIGNVINEGDEDDDFLNDVDKSTLTKKKSKWSKLKLKDKLGFIPKWYILFILGDLFHLMSGITFLSSNAFTPQNIVFFGFSSLFSWISCGYYFQGHFKYDYIYDTLQYSIGIYSKLLIVFATLFSGFALTHLTLFPSSEHWFNGGYNTFETLAAEVFGDSYLLVWSSTIEKFPLRTVLLALAIYVIFTGCHLRVMFVMTEEAFQHVLLKKKFDWNKKQKISVEDYIDHEIALNEEEDEANGDKNYFMDDIWIKAIVEKDDVNQILKFDPNKINANLYNVEQIKAFFNKKAKKIKKRNLSTNIINEIFNYDFEKDVLGLAEGVGKTDTIIMYETHRGIDALFGKLKRYLKGMEKNEKENGLFSEIEKSKKKEILDKMLKKFNAIKNLIK